MKLLFCDACGDIVKLRSETRTCSCKKSGGHYTNHLDAVYWGPAMPLGVDNMSFATALHERPTEGKGFRFAAFVIPKRCPTMIQLEGPDGTPVAI